MLRHMHRLSIVIAFASLMLAALLSGAALGGAAHADVQNGPPPPARYRVILPAADRTARTALTEAGVALDAIGEDSVVTVVDADGLARLRAQGLTPLAVAPLDFPPADSAYHNYAEMTAAIQQIAAAHPDIIRVYTAGLEPAGPADPRGQDQRRAGRGRSDRAGGALLRAHPRPRASDRRDGAGGDPPVHRRLRRRSRADQSRQHARDLGAAECQPGWRRIRHRERLLSVVAQEPAAESRRQLRRRSEPQLRLSLGMLRRIEQ